MGSFEKIATLIIVIVIALLVLVAFAMQKPAAQDSAPLVPQSSVERERLQSAIWLVKIRLESGRASGKESEERFLAALLSVLQGSSESEKEER